MGPTITSLYFCPGGILTEPFSFPGLCVMYPIELPISSGFKELGSKDLNASVSKSIFVIS